MRFAIGVKRNAGRCRLRRNACFQSTFSKSKELKMSKDKRTFGELSSAEQEMLLEWVNTALFPTMDGGISMPQIQRECFFLTDLPSTILVGYKEIWEPSAEAIHTALKESGWVKQRGVKQSIGGSI